MKKQTIITTIFAAGILLPLAAQTVLRMPESRKASAEEIEAAALTKTGASKLPAGMSMADKQSYEAYVQEHGTEPSFPRRSPFGPEDETLYKYTGFNAAAGLTDEGTQTGGWVNFNLDPEFACDTVSSHGGASPYSYVKGSELHSILPIRDSNWNYTQIQTTVYDANTLEYIDMTTTNLPKKDQSYCPYIMTYDDQRDVVYCITMGADVDGVQPYYFNIFDEKENKVKRLGLLGNWVRGAKDADQFTPVGLVASYGTLYVLVKRETWYLGKINPSTCNIEWIGTVDMPMKYAIGTQPMIADPGGSLIVNHYDLENGTQYYKVPTWKDYQTGEIKVEKICNAPTGFTFFYQRPETLNPTIAPVYEFADPTDVEISAISDREIKVEMTLPSKLKDGSEIEYPSWVQHSQKTFRVNPYVNNVYQTPIGLPSTIRPGDHISFTVDLQASEWSRVDPGLVTVKVGLQFGYNEVGMLNVYRTLLVGDDAPAAPTNIRAVADGQSVNLSWNAPTESRFADFGYELDPSKLTYTVIRDNDGKVVADNITDTFCVDNIESEEFTTYSYKIYGLTGSTRGDAGESPKVNVGSYLVMPYLNEFDNKDCLDGWAIHNVNQDGSACQWQWNSNYFSIYNLANRMADDWIITPPFRLKKGEVYEIALSQAGEGDLRVWYGKGNNYTDMTTRLATFTKTHRNGEPESTAIYFVAPEDGEFNIGLHDYKTDNGWWNIYSFGMQKVASGNSPGYPADAKFTPESEGAYTGTVTAVMPSTTCDGTALSAISAFVVYDIVTGKELARNDNVKPGEEASVKLTLEHGWNNLKAAAIDANGEGWPATLDVYAGADVAKSLKNLKATWGETPHQLILTWDVPTEGANGGYINPDDLSYVIYKYDPHSYPDRVKIAETFDNEVSIDILDNDKQEQYIISVTSVTSEGESAYANTSVLIGEAYNLPAVEPVGGGTGFNYSPYITTVTSGNAIFAIDGGFYNDNVQPQNNDQVQIVFQNKGVSEASALFSTPIFDFAGTNNPVLRIWVNHSEGFDPATWFTASATTNGHDYTEVSDRVALTGNNGWQLHVFDLSSVAGKKAMIGFCMGNKDPKDRIFFDNYRIAEAAGNDLAITGISKTRYERPGQTADINVTVANLGARTAKDFIVMFNVNGETVGEKEVTDALAPGQEKVFTFPLKLTAGDNGATEYYAELLYDGDLDESNNVSPRETVNLVELQLPAPTNMTVSADDKQLSWTAPVVEAGREVTLDFEDIPAFTTDNIEGWTTIDGDKHLNLGFIQYYNNYWPYNQQPVSWMTWNAKEAGCPTATVWTAYEGDNCLIVFGNYGQDASGRDNSGESEDDWFISPELLGGSDFSFMTSSNEEGSVIEVLVSTTDRNPGSFTQKLTTVNCTTASEWKEVKTQLPADAKYVALHVTRNGFGILVDNIRYTEAATPQLQGYNVYNRNSLLGYCEQPTFAAAGNGSYAASAVYDLGESPLSNRAATSGIDTIEAADGSIVVATDEGILTVFGADGENVTVAGIDGTLRFNGKVASDLTLQLPAGIYMVKVGEKSAKVIVK